MIALYPGPRPPHVAVMTRHDAIDPSPRSYAPGVHLVQRARFEPDALTQTTPEAVEDWLLGPALNEADLVTLFNSFACKLAMAGLAVHRASLHTGTLHPQLIGYAWNWSIRDGICDEIQVSAASLDTDAYRRNPIARVIEDGAALSFRADAPSPEAGPLVRELFADGFTQYDIFPLSTGTARHNSASIATDQPGGFTDTQYDTIMRLFRLFALHVERHSSERIAENIAAAYLGAGPGHLVHQGQIKRGDGASVPAIIWVSDLRDFTGLSEQLEDSAVISVLNAYFAALAQAVMDHGGEVLKFMGDGLLAVFRFADFSDARTAAQAALNAARDGRAAVAALTADPATLPELPADRKLRSGIALHKGAVFFGNIGAPDRLDFTVIGPHVNTAARVEALCKKLGRPLLVTEPVASLLDTELEDMGAHALRGQTEPVGLFAPTDAG